MLRPEYDPALPIEERIAAMCDDSTPEAIARTIASMVRRRDLLAGEQLPTVRKLAHSLGVSTNTVSAAWQTLQRHGVIATARRNGTVISAERGEITGRFWRVPAVAGSTIVDLSTGTPDTNLLPTIESMLGALPANIAITSYIDRPVLEELETVLRDLWPFEPDGLTVVDGALDALDRLIDVTVSFGDTVVVEDPTFPPILDMLERAGATIVGVGMDHEGVQLDQLAAALTEQPVVAIFQPVIHNPTGRSMSPQRAADIAEMFEQTSPDTWIFEDHHTGDLSEPSTTSLGGRLGHRVVRVHSFSKSHGPDLRIAAIGGAKEPIAALVDRRRLGPSWTSRLVQHMLLALLRDPGIAPLIGHARDVYAQRRRHIIDGLAEHGIQVDGDGGLNLWIPVADEQRAVVSLALNGIGAAPGSPFMANPDSQSNHIRLSVGNAREELDSIVAAVAVAARS